MGAASRELSGWLGRCDDRARLVAVAVLGLGLSALREVWVGAVGLGVVLAVAVSLPGVAGVAWRRLRPLWVLLVPVVVLTPWWRPEGAVVWGWSWGPTDRGLEVTARVVLRALSVGGISALGLSAASFERTVRGLQGLRVPESLVHLTLLTVRYVERVGRDLWWTRRALETRGFEAGANGATVRTYGAVAGGLLVRSLGRTERLEAAMRARGYAGRWVGPPRAGWRARDTALVVGACGVAGGLLVAEWAARAGWIYSSWS